MKLLRSSTPGRVPTAAQLAAGQLAINLADEVVYYLNASGSVKSLPVTALVALLGGAVRFDASQTLTAAQQKQAATNLNLPLTVFRNRALNGNFKISQRAVSGTVTLAAGAYGHDRWKAGSSGCTYTFATNGIDVVITITAGSLLQVIGALSIEGGAYTLSWSGTATGRVYQSGTAPSFAAGPLSATLTAAVTTTVEFSTGTLGAVQLEPGVLATAFERRTAQVELLLCQQYFYTTYDTNVAPGSATSSYGPIYSWFPMLGNFYTLPFLFATTMHAVPTITIYSAYNGASGYLNNASTNVPAYAASITKTGTTVAVNNTSMQGGLTGHITASAEN